MAEVPDIPRRLPLIIEPSNRGDSTSFDARLVNCYSEKKGEDYWIYERPGMDEFQRPPAGNASGFGMTLWRGNVYSIFGDTVYKDGVAIAGTVDITNGVYKFSTGTLGATPRLQLGNGVEAYNYDAGAGLVNIVDVDFPSPFVKGWAYLDGTQYVGRPDAGIQGSDINDTINWSALNVIIAQIEPDQGKALGKQLVNVIALKEWTTEVFYDAGNATGSPLGRVEGSKANWGCLSSDSVEDVGGALFWLGSVKNGKPQVLMMDRLRVDAISTKPIERLLDGADLDTIYAWGVKVNGHKFYVLTVKEENLTLAYDIAEREWSQWTDANGNYLPIVAACSDVDGRQLVQHESNGRIYYMGDEFATDDGDLITVDIITPNFDGGVAFKKMLGRLTAVGDQRAGSILQVRVNDHDYNPTKWSGWRNFDMSQRRPYIPDCGTFVQRAHHFRHRRPVRMPRIQAMEMVIDLGTA